MDFAIKDININIVEVARQIGYVIIDTNPNGEYNMVRKLAVDNYPRFHIYLQQQGSTYNFGLHLDQKQPSYGSLHAHSGEYFGPVVDEEVERIKGILENKDFD